MSADDDLVPLTPAAPQPTAGGRWGAMKPRSRAAYITPPPVVDTPVPNRPDPYAGAIDPAGRRLTGFYCRVVTTGVFGGVSGSVFRAFAADDCLILVDSGLTSLDPNAPQGGGMVATAIAGGIGGALLAGAVGSVAAMSARARVEAITSALEQADERAVRAYVRGDKNGKMVPTTGLVGVTVAPLSTWDKMAHQGVAKATFAAPVGGVAGLHLLSMHDLGPAIGEFTRLSGSTARVTIDWATI